MIFPRGKAEEIRRTLIEVGTMNKTVLIFLALMAISAGVAEGVTPAVNITSPEKNASVSMNESVNGTAKGIPAGYTMFMVVLANKTYHPQGYPINLTKDGRFSTRAYFGGENDSGTKFELLAVVADARATKELDAYLNKADKEKTYPGMPALPKGAAVAARVEVIRA
jgi:hypothetical protein